MYATIIKNAHLINEHQSIVTDIAIDKEGKIAKLAGTISEKAEFELDAKGNWLLPGAIDDQVHFREPGLTHKGEIYTESRAALAGGVTSYMEMPNVVPPTLSQSLLEEKYELAAQKSWVNYSFYMGVSNDNYDEVMKTDPKKVCGIKIFMGSSTGNLLVDEPDVLEKIFANSPTLIATHCEKDTLVKANQERLIAELGKENLTARHHPLIRDVEACYASSSFAVGLAKKHGTQLHVLHLSTAKELSLFENTLPLAEKRITAEACIHHLWFSDEDYPEKGNFIKWNPAVKSAEDRAEIWKALLDGRIDVIATDHAPHTLEEKSAPFLNAPSGGPLVQHSLLAMLDFVEQGKISIEKVVEKMAHAVATLYKIENRGFVKEGYWADLVLVEKNKGLKVEKSNLLYKCGWSPFEGHTFPHRISHTFVNGELRYAEGEVLGTPTGKRLRFNR